MILYAVAVVLLASGNDAELWKLLDDPRAPMDQLKAAAGKDPAKVAELLRKGRPLAPVTPGETKEKLTDAFGRETDLWVVVPKGYSHEKPAGVLIVLHGLGGNGEQVKRLLSDFAEEHNYILLCPTAQKEPAQAPNEDSADLAAQFFKHWWCYRDGDFPLSALAGAKRRFAVDENRVLLAGASMGGFGTWQIGLRHADRFSGLLPMCGGLSRIEFAGGRDDRMRKLLANVFHVPVYFIHGDQDEVVPVAPERWTRDDLKSLKLDSVYVEVPKGKHDLRPQWADLRKGIDPWLQARVRQPHPAEVRHHAVNEHAPQSFWVRVAEFAGGAADVKAVAKGQTIDVTATGAKKLTLYLDEKLIDLSKPVRVTSKGRKLFEGKAAPKVETVIESWRAREDRELLYRAAVTVTLP